MCAHGEGYAQSQIETFQKFAGTRFLKKFSGFSATAQFLRSFEPFWDYYVFCMCPIIYIYFW
jgi:hypothetical protein